VQRKLAAAIAYVRGKRAFGEETPMAIETADFNAERAGDALLPARLAGAF
jgi:hypothetical protein